MTWTQRILMYAAAAILFDALASLVGVGFPSFAVEWLFFVGLGFVGSAWADYWKER